MLVHCSIGATNILSENLFHTAGGCIWHNRQALCQMQCLKALSGNRSPSSAHFRIGAIGIPAREYYLSIANARTRLGTYLRESKSHHFFVAGAESQPLDAVEIKQTVAAEDEIA